MACADTPFFHILLLLQLLKGSDVQEVYDYLKTVCTDIHITRGNFDEAAAKYPEDEVRECLIYLADEVCEYLVCLADIKYGAHSDDLL